MSASDKDEHDRAHIYTSSYLGIEEALVYTEVENASDQDRDPMQVYVELMTNEFERQAMFNPEYTHVGISCGCHSKYSEMCCFLFGKQVIDK